MPSLGMNGPFDLTVKSINNAVTKTSPGNYGLGYVNDEDIFIVKYVGRADSDLNKRLQDHIGEGYKSFKYSYATSPKAAFEKECKNYHDFKRLDNKIHPDRPSNSKNWTCPYCDKFDT